MNKKALNVLVVDDDKNFAHTLCDILKSEGYISEEVHSAEAAQKILLSGNFDFVLSDVKMQNQSGVDLYYKVKKEHPNLPFILLTAYTSNEIIDEALEAGVLATFQKPIDINHILQYFAKLSNSLKGAIICEEEICDFITHLMKNKTFSFTIFSNIDQFIQSNLEDYSLVLIDTHDYCDHFSDSIKTLLDLLPDNTIIIVCDIKKTTTLEEDFAHKVNLFILPRESKTENKIESIIQNLYFQQARKYIF